MFKKKDHVKKFSSYMNSQHTNIKCACEVENENKVYFLGALTTPF